MRSSASARRWRSRAKRTGQEQRGGEQARAPARLQRDLDRLAHGELREQQRGLERAPETHARPARRTGRRHVVAVEPHRACARHEAADRVHERRLPGAVRADEAHDLVVADAQAGVVDRDDPTETNADSRDFERGDVLDDRRPGRADQHWRRRGRAFGRRRFAFRCRPAEQGVARRVHDLHQPTGEVEQQDQQAEARGQQRHQRVVGEERGEPDDPQRAEHRAHRRRDAADHHQRDEQRASRPPGSSAR